ncbi:MAG: HD domain-containing protein [Pyrobaculum sp.]
MAYNEPPFHPLQFVMECKKIRVKLSIPDSVAKVVETLKNAGYEAYVVGGAVRDLLLLDAANNIKDYDIATSARPQEILQLFPSAVYVDPASSFPVLRLQVDDIEIDITTYRRETAKGRRNVQWLFANSLHEDAARRDFSVNALYYDPIGGYVIDCFNGFEDLRARKIRFTGVAEERIEEDPLRLLRALRLAAKLGFNLGTSTITAIRHSAKLITVVPRERIWEEIWRAASTKRFSYFVGLMSQTYLLPYVMPHISMLSFVPPPPVGEHQGEGNMFMHTLRVLSRLDGYAAPPDVKLAALYHDSGYIYTARVRGRLSYPGHEEASAKIAEEELTALRAPRRVVRLVVFLVRQHMRLHHISSSADRRSVIRSIAGFAFDVITASRLLGTPPQQLASYIATLYLADFGDRRIAELFTHLATFPMPRVDLRGVKPDQRVNALKSAFVQQALRSLL